MDDIIFSATNEYLCKEFSNLMQREFEMSNDGKMNFFFGLQIQQIQERVFINRTKYTKKKLLKRFGMEIQGKLELLCVHPPNLIRIKNVPM